MRTPRFPRFADLPATLPVFPLSGALLLPGGALPLNIFEPRYLAMTDDALAGDRLVGMIQPAPGAEGAEVPELYRTGCAGRIVRFSETGDGRYLITLGGVARFDIDREIDGARGYRRVVPDWRPWRGDLEPEGDPDIDRERLTRALRAYFAARGIEADWDAIGRAGAADLIASLATGCPFEPTEKQAILVAGAAPERARTVLALLEMALHPAGGADDARH